MLTASCVQVSLVSFGAECGPLPITRKYMLINWFEKIEDENSNFPLEKPGWYHPTQVIKVNITSYVMLMSCVTSYGDIRRTFDLLALLPNLILRKKSDSNWGVFSRIPDKNSSKLSRSKKQQQRTNCPRPEETEETMIKCPVGPQRNPGVENGQQWNTGNLNKVCSLVKWQCTNVDFLVLKSVQWLCKMLIFGESGWLYIWELSVLYLQLFFKPKTIPK